MKRIIFIIALLGVCVFATSVHALNSQNLRYYFPGSRTLSLVESAPKAANTLTLGFGFNYGYQPFEYGNASGNVRVQSIVDHLATFDFNASYSFSDRVAVGLGIPMHITSNITVLGGTTMETPVSFGDIMLTGIYNIIQPGSNFLNIGVSVVPFLTLPSGNDGNFVGESHVTGGLLLVGDIEYDRHYFGLNLGFRMREQEQFLNLDVASEFLYTAAYNFKIIPDADLSSFLELGGATVMKNFWQEEIASPFELKLGVSKGFLAEYQLKATAFGGLGIGNGYGNPNVRFGFKVTYDHQLPRTREVVKIVESKIEKVEKELKELTIYYPTDGSHVDPFYDQKIAGIAKIMKQNPNLGPIYIVGNTDDVGSDGYNQHLSETRARTAARSIIDNGLAQNDIVWIGLGERYPIVTNSSDANRALNRRTLFTFIKHDQLEEKQTKRGVVGVNTITGKRNDSYTEVLKDLEKKSATDDLEAEAVATKKYKDKSEVTAEKDGTTKIKDKPTAAPKTYYNKPRSKKYYESQEKRTTTVKTKKGGIVEETIFEDDIVEDL